MRVKLTLIIIMIVGQSCIYDLEFTDAKNQTLVINGAVSNVPKEHFVRVFYSSAFGERSEYVNDAEVYIVDDLGNKERLIFKYFGRYFSDPEFHGEIGRSYHAEVILNDGTIYLSHPEELRPSPEIDQISYQRINDKVKFLGTFDDDQNERQYYQWRYKGTYVLHAPLASSELEYCWTSDFDNEFLNLIEDELFDGRTLKEYPIVSIDFDRRFNFGYFVTFELQSLNEGAFDYLEKFKNQIGNTGTIFEKSNFRIQGNIYNPEDSEQFVLGYFQVSGETNYDLFVADFLNQFGIIECSREYVYPERCENCLLQGALATNVKPDYWPLNYE